MQCSHGLGFHGKCTVDLQRRDAIGTGGREFGTKGRTRVSSSPKRIPRRSSQHQYFFFNILSRLKDVAMGCRMWKHSFERFQIANHVHLCQRRQNKRVQGKKIRL